MDDQISNIAEWALYTECQEILDGIFKFVSNRGLELNDSFRHRKLIFDFVHEDIPKLVCSASNDNYDVLRSFDALYGEFAEYEGDWVGLRRLFMKQLGVCLINTEAGWTDDENLPDSAAASSEKFMKTKRRLTLFERDVNDLFSEHHHKELSAHESKDVKFVLQVATTTKRVNEVCDFVREHPISALKDALREFMRRMEISALKIPCCGFYYLDSEGSQSSNSQYSQEWTVEDREKKGPYSSVNTVKSPNAHAMDWPLTQPPSPPPTPAKRTVAMATVKASPSISKPAPTIPASSTSAATASANAGKKDTATSATIHAVQAAVKNLRDNSSAKDPIVDILGPEEPVTALLSVDTNTTSAGASSTSAFKRVTRSSKNGPSTPVAEEPTSAQSFAQSSDSSPTANKTVTAKSKTTHVIQENDDESGSDAEQAKAKSKKRKPSPAKKARLVDSRPSAKRLDASEVEQGLEDSISEFSDGEGVATRHSLDRLKEKEARPNFYRERSPSPHQQKRTRWSAEEEDALIRAYAKYANNYAGILIDPAYSEILSLRTNVNLKDKVRNLQKHGRL